MIDAATPLSLTLLGLLVTVGSVVSAGSAGVLCRLGGRFAATALDDHADPLQVMSVIHGVTFAVWVVVAAFGFGISAALLLAAAGLLVQVFPAVDAGLRDLAERLGLGGFGRASLMAQACVIVAAATAYAATAA
ncbi:hypothetical protein [Oharaeibacter diazotrophicus]|uniref:DUF350 domain-containing protein n=1 Tax=Oharaeibacter diazotrophicus TaxID=1920512 RepID=A0A4R6RFC6_9HYPH|nr:hypothetical protein [Oharaeibacter diazotrophicus]TDP84366.1 hypothetical protein EDD54_2973 [Oharaeibacter diazotrophicus]BBE73403.1 hypothetical protein OHA_1_03014 [Pleomorphomonas sp. SM30]GLS75196.1 hypothetical protein GCM10007904_05310 [Oharaeibacter diazotrophicus]